MCDSWVSQFALAHEYSVTSMVSQFFGSEGMSSMGYSSAHEYLVTLIMFQFFGSEGMSSISSSSEGL